MHMTTCVCVWVCVYACIYACMYLGVCIFNLVSSNIDYMVTGIDYICPKSYPMYWRVVALVVVCVCVCVFTMQLQILVVCVCECVDNDDDVVALVPDDDAEIPLTDWLDDVDCLTRETIVNGSK